LKGSSTYQPYISKDIGSQPVLLIQSGLFVWFVSFVWLNETNQINQRNQIDQTNQPDQNCAERPMPTLVSLIELDSKLSFRLER
jgi:hypothetical protein